jgi:tetratricopeptide (TPR) repeat protein
MAHYQSGLALTVFGDFEKAHHHFQKALEINEKLGVLWGILLVSGNKVWANLAQGNIDLAYEKSNEDILLAEGTSDIYTKAVVSFNHGCSCLYKGLFDKARDLLLSSVTLSEKIDNLFWAGQFGWDLGNANFYLGRFEESYICYQKAILNLERTKTHPSLIELLKIASARAKIMSNEKDIDLELLYRCAKKIKADLFEVWVPRYLGDILLNIDNKHITEAESWIKKSIEANNRRGLSWHLGRDHMVYAELFQRKHEPEKAKESLFKAIENFKECGADGWAKRTAEKLAQL